jgi:hypothetical protein
MSGCFSNFESKQVGHRNDFVLGVRGRLAGGRDGVVEVKVG